MVIMSNDITSQIESNKNRTWIIIGLFCLFIATLGFIWGKTTGFAPSWTITAIVISSMMSLFSYFYGDKMILKMSKAKPADKNKDKDFFYAVGILVKKAGIPAPKLYVIEETAPNAFATGRDPNHASVCVTRGLLEKLDYKEMEGVIAHELSHVKNYDIRLMAIVSVLVGTVVYLADWFMRSLWWGGAKRDREEKNGLSSVFFMLGILLALLTPFIATLIQLAISRRREFLADGSGALLTKNPEGLAKALEKISYDKAVLHAANNATAHLFIANPFKGKSFGKRFSGLFDTHPPMEERVKILRSMRS